MRMLKLSTRPRRGLRLAIAGGGVAVLVGGGATAAFAATSATAAPADSTLTATTSGSCTPSVARLIREIPDSLRADLKTLRTDSASQKAAERALIKQKALAGDYGVRIGRVAQIVDGHSSKLASQVPAALKADLKTLHGDAPGSQARKDEVATIWSKAVSGAYGSHIETLAKDAEAKRQAHCSATPTPSASTPAS